MELVDLGAREVLFHGREQFAVRKRVRPCDPEITGLVLVGISLHLGLFRFGGRGLRLFRLRLFRLRLFRISILRLSGLFRLFGFIKSVRPVGSFRLFRRFGHVGTFRLIESFSLFKYRHYAVRRRFY